MVELLCRAAQKGINALAGIGQHGADVLRGHLAPSQRLNGVFDESPWPLLGEQHLLQIGRGRRYIQHQLDHLWHQQDGAIFIIYGDRLSVDLLQHGERLIAGHAGRREPGDGHALGKYPLAGLPSRVEPGAQQDQEQNDDETQPADSAAFFLHMYLRGEVYPQVRHRQRSAPLQIEISESAVSESAKKRKGESVNLSCPGMNSGSDTSSSLKRAFPTTRFSAVDSCQDGDSIPGQTREMRSARRDLDNPRKLVIITGSGPAA